MNDKGYTEAIRDRIQEFGALNPFSRSDFDDLAPVESVRTILNILVESGEIKRLIRGLFYLPKTSRITGDELEPSLHDTALALARNYNWRITPSGNMALNQLRLSTQVPMKAVYISDGPYRIYEVGSRSIEFKHRAPKDVRNISATSSLVIQALKAIGKDKVTSTDRATIRKALTTEQRQDLLKEGKGATSWVYETIKRISEGENDE